MTWPASRDLPFAHALADMADRLTGASFTVGRRVDHDVKRDGTPVTVVDRIVEEALLERVQRDRPGDAFMGEEVGAHGRSRRCWIVDGIDGTSEFVTGFPLWSTLIALVDDGRPVLGLSTSPAQQRRWWAVDGQGAWTAALYHEGHGPAEPITVADPPAGRPRAWVGPWVESLPGHPTPPTVDRLLTQVDAVSMTSHPAIMVAAGDLDLAMIVASGPWDAAAIMPIVWEAGGRCLDPLGADVRHPQELMVFVGRMDLHDVHDLLIPTDG